MSGARKKPPTLAEIYETLLNAYGPQGWWPLLEHNGTNPTKTGSITGYHPGQYDFPKTERQRFEICIGAILTQNTAWINVERALFVLEQMDALTPEGLGALRDDQVRMAIRPAGYFNAKTRKLRELAAFHTALNGRVPDREELLAVWGVGPETADSIRLYAYGQKEMVVDAYTRRILEHLKLVQPNSKYDDLKGLCINGLPEDLIVYQEFHALLVEHAKRCYARRPFQDNLLR
ncbi:MAG: endonuclease III domain-containing protein [Lentisphaeria bacterium]|nr:endonuclease III domain-containing protein [Lentisphaeria bacterium]